MEYPISLDTALAIVGSMKMKKIKEISNSKNPADESRLLQELDMYAEEEEMLYGFNDFVRLSVMDKVVRLYFPILKKNILDYKVDELINRKDSVRNYYNKQLKLIFKELKINNQINFYTARHTFATLSLKNGVHVSKIKQALGHQSIKTTESYLEDFNDHEIDEAFEKLI